MTEDPDRVRIGTAEREDALELLGRQFSEGRLNPGEVAHGWLALPLLGILLYR